MGFHGEGPELTHAVGPELYHQERQAAAATAAAVEPPPPPLPQPQQQSAPGCVTLATEARAWLPPNPGPTEPSCLARLLVRRRCTELSDQTPMYVYMYPSPFSPSLRVASGLPKSHTRVFRHRVGLKRPAPTKS
ncbi:hypothetical protein PLESTF_000095600 [Pleodorina starrii]|nr:hypothetical protein PLESTM_001261400 [Pleodorina starrii]GLC63893.1 hypothetical protein PLESTF_000095600 [Pleodorina starrii]